MAIIKKIKLPNEATARDIGANSSNIIYDGDAGATTTLNDKIQSIFTAIGDINSFEIAIVSELPATGDDHTIYFVPESEGSTSHNEYMYIDNQWELIGTTTIDLSNYLQKTDITIAQGLTTGVPAATITVGATTTTIYSNNAPVQSDWKQATTTSLDYIKNKPAIWDSEDYTVPSGQTYGDSTTKAIGAVALNLSTNNAKGNYSISEGYHGRNNKVVSINGVSTTLPYGASGDYSHAEGHNTIASGDSSHSEGISSIASGDSSHSEGISSIASGDSSHSEGNASMAYGRYSHAEGNTSMASGASSHSEGSHSVASGECSHAEGNNTAATGTSSHSEGLYSIASGNYSHAEGYGLIITAVLNAADANSTSYTLSTPVEVSNSNLLSANNMFIYSKNSTGSTAAFNPITPVKITACTISGNSLTGFTVANTLFTSAITTGAVLIALPRAKNYYAHVQGSGTVSNAIAQHVAGKWNVQTTGAEVIGNGTNDLNRSNIRTLDWDGNEWLAGKVTVTNLTPTVDGDLTTKQYVDNAVSGITPDVSALTPTLDDRYVNTTGDTMTGLLTASTHGIKITNSSDQYRNITVKAYAGYVDNYDEANPRLLLDDDGGTGNVVISGVATPKDNTDAANKLYVDSKVSAITVPTITPVAALTTGITIGSIDVSGVTTTFYAPAAVTPTTYTMSMTGPTINLLADGVAASTITLPIYDGTII